MKKRSNRNKDQQQRVKNLLLERYSNFCWLCAEKFKLRDLTLHHIIEHQSSHHTIVEESCILCISCHFGIVNKTTYLSKEYNLLMHKVEEYRKTH